MRNKIVDGHFHLLTLFQLLQNLSQKLKIKGIRVVKIVFIVFGQFVLLLVKDLGKIDLINSCRPKNQDSKHTL
jgi:hypothetical protein